MFSYKKSYDIDKAINLFYESKATSLISNKRFIWEQSKNKLYSLNYDYKKRDRTQNVNKHI